MLNKTLVSAVLILAGIFAATAASANVTPNGEDQKQPRYKYKTAGSGFSFFPFLSIELIKSDTSAVSAPKESPVRDEKVISSPAAF